MVLAVRRVRRDAANALSINSLAARGEQGVVNRLMREWAE